MGDNVETLKGFDQWQATRGFSNATRKRRTSSLGAFARWIAPVELTAADAEMIEEWLSSKSGTSTRHAYLSDLSSFYKWAVRRHIIPCSPVDEIDRIKVPKTLPRPVSADLIPAIIACAPDYELRVMLALASYAGLRRSEIAALRIEDVALHVRQPHLIVRAGKGGKDRIVGLHPALVTILAATRRRAGRWVNVTPGRVGIRIAEHLRTACGIDATAHCLRHSFATEFARVANGNVIAVSRALGHESTETSMRYIGWNAALDSREIGLMYPAAG